MTKIICLELNEVPNEIMIEIISDINLKKYQYNFEFTPTISLDNNHLHPWVTWSSVHRGINHSEHLISDINQECGYQDKKYPTIMSELSKKGYKVGVFGSMHSGRVPISEFKKYSFFVPEAFSGHSHCKPESLNGFQKLNLVMSKSSAREVSKELPNIKSILKALISYVQHIYKLRSLFCLIKQLISEIFSPWKKSRRRILQSDILFDIYMNLLYKHTPDYSNFFTNHLASSMHRFWEAKFPYQYKKQVSTNSWINKYKNEIDIAINSAKYYIKSLMEYVDNNSDTQLWIISSMGQSAVQEYKKSQSYWQISDMNSFLSSLLEKKIEVKQLTQMIPIYGIESSELNINLVADKLSKVKSNIDIKISSRTKTTLAFIFNKKAFKNKQEIPYFENLSNYKRTIIKGLKKVKINENTGTSAYHVPEGIFYRYGVSLNNLDHLLREDGFLPITCIKDLALDLCDDL